MKINPLTLIVLLAVAYYLGGHPGALYGLQPTLTGIDPGVLTIGAVAFGLYLFVKKLK